MADTPHPDDPFLDRLLAVPELLGASISPALNLLSWTWAGHGPRIASYLSLTKEQRAPVRLHAEDDDVVLRSWRRDGKEFLLALGPEADDRVRLTRTAIADMAPKQLVSAQGNFRIDGGELHPSGRWLVFGANLDPATGQETEASWVIRHDIASGEQLALARPKRPARPLPTINPQGTHVLYARRDRHPAGRQYWLVDIEGKTDREILNFGDDVEITASWAPSGQQVLVMADSGSHRRVGLWVLATSLIFWLLDDPHDQIEDAFIPFGSPAIVLVAANQGRRRSIFYDPQKRTRSAWQPGQGATVLPVAPLPGGAWAVRSYGARQPDDLLRLQPGAAQGQAPASLTGLPTLIGKLPEELLAPEELRWAAPDGRALQGWLYRAREPRGTVVKLHEPGQQAEERFDPLAQYLLRRGFNVFMPNYRGSSGFGLSFRQAILTKGWGGAEQEDIRSGIAGLIAKGIAAKGRVGILGSGFGGYCAWWGLTHSPTELVAAGAAISAFADLDLHHRTTRPDCRAEIETALGGAPAALAQRYRDRSPIHRVGEIKGRLLIAHGLQDPVVAPENFTAARQALEAAGRPYEALGFEDEGRVIRLRANRRRLWLKLAEFFEAAFSAAT